MMVCCVNHTSLIKNTAHKFHCKLLDNVHKIAEMRTFNISQVLICEISFTDLITQLLGHESVNSTLNQLNYIM